MQINVSVIIALILAISFIFMLSFIIYSSRRVRRTVATYARLRGLVITSYDKDGAFAKTLEQRLGIFKGGIYNDIIKLTISEEAYLFNGCRGIERSSNKEAIQEDPHYFIAVFMEIPISGLIFLMPHTEIKGKLSNKIFDYAMQKAPGAMGTRAVDIKDRFPEFAKTHAIFSNNEDEVFNIILTPDMMPTLSPPSILASPLTISYNISLFPGGLFVEIDPLFKKYEDVEFFVLLAENISRALNAAGGF